MCEAVPGLGCTMPFRCMPGKDLAPEQRAHHMTHCMVRIPYQNGVRRAKVFRIIKYRNKLKWHDDTTTSPAERPARPSC